LGAKYEMTYDAPTDKRTGEENVADCQPLAVSDEKFTDASLVPFEDHSVPEYGPEESAGLQKRTPTAEPGATTLNREPNSTGPQSSAAEALGRAGPHSVESAEKLGAEPTARMGRVRAHTASHSVHRLPRLWER